VLVIRLRHSINEAVPNRFYLRKILFSTVVGGLQKFSAAEGSCLFSPGRGQQLIGARNLKIETWHRIGLMCGDLKVDRHFENQLY
jgi:hypothetical protein